MGRIAQLCLVVLGVYSGFAVAQAVPPALPNAPLFNAALFSGLDQVLSGNGAPEYSNATPQVKQSIEDQSDDQENPAFFTDHLIDDQIGRAHV